jgi:hypothetical protein
MSGEGTFNWRCVFTTKLPTNNSSITLRVYDKDLLSSNDFIGSAAKSIQEVLDEAYETQ